MSRSPLSRRTALVAVLAPLVTAGLVATAGPAARRPVRGRPVHHPVPADRRSCPARARPAAPSSSPTGTSPYSGPARRADPGRSTAAAPCRPAGGGSGRPSAQVGAGRLVVPPRQVPVPLGAGQVPPGDGARLPQPHRRARSGTADRPVARRGATTPRPGSRDHVGGGRPDVLGRRAGERHERPPARRRTARPCRPRWRRRPSGRPRATRSAASPHRRELHRLPRLPGRGVEDVQGAELPAGGEQPPVRREGQRRQADRSLAGPRSARYVEGAAVQDHDLVAVTARHGEPAAVGAELERLGSDRQVHPLAPPRCPTSRGRRP